MIWQQLCLAAIVAAAVLLFYSRWRDKFGGERFRGDELRRNETPDTRAPPGADIPEFSLFVLDFLMAGAGAVVFMLLTGFLGLQKMGAGTVLPIFLGLVPLIAVAGGLFLWLCRSRNLKRKLLTYAAIVTMVVAYAHQ